MRIACYQASIQAPHDNTWEEGDSLMTQLSRWDTGTEQNIKEMASSRATKLIPMVHVSFKHATGNHHRSNRPTDFFLGPKPSLKVGSILDFQIATKSCDMMSAAFKYWKGHQDHSNRPTDFTAGTKKTNFTWKMTAILKSRRHIGFWNGKLTVEHFSSSKNRQKDAQII